MSLRDKCKNLLALGAGALVLSPIAAAANCAEDTLLRCQIGKSKVLEVCISAAERFEYSFGPAGKPELALSTPFSAGTVSAPWHGVGRSISSSVDFQNGPYTYRVWHSFDRIDNSENPFSGGVSVFEGDRSLTDLTCTPSPQNIIAPPFTLEDTMQGAGYCYSEKDFLWSKQAC